MRFRLSVVSTSFYRNFCLVAAGVDASSLEAHTLVNRRLATQKGPACMPRFSRLQCCPPAARGATHDWQRLQLGNRLIGRTNHASGAVYSLPAVTAQRPSCRSRRRRFRAAPDGPHGHCHASGPQGLGFRAAGSRQPRRPSHPRGIGRRRQPPSVAVSPPGASAPAQLKRRCRVS